MKFNRLLTLGLVCCAIVGLSRGAGTAQDAKKGAPETEAKFREFSPEGAKFKILMPGKPKDQSRETGGLDVKIWVVEAANNGAYLVSSTELPGAKNLAEDTTLEVLDKSATGQINGMGGKETKRKEIKLDKKHPGLEVEAKINNPNAPGQAISRLFVIDGKLYQILALGNKEFVEGKDVRKFLDSFEILKDK